jgi:hypothetical protein
MDREAAVLRAEMSRTRAELDQKLALLQTRVHELTPRRLSERYLPDYFVDRLIGGILTLVGVKMAWSQYRARHDRAGRQLRMRGALAAHW